MRGFLKKYRDSADPALSHFMAHVLSCVPNEKQGYEVVLDETAFFPEGGGQPADTGLLGTAHVLDVQEKQGAVIHYTDAPLEVGDCVEGAVDWVRRFDHMQQHSGEHIVSGLAHKMYGVNNVGFHLGALVTADLDGELDAQQVAEIERRANEIIWADKPIVITYPSSEELEHIRYRSKKELTGEVRIVTIEGADVCACCGTHVASTGQIGLIRLTDAQRYKGGTRLTILCGGRAQEDYACKDMSLAHAGTLLSVKPHEVPSAVKRLLDEVSRLKQERAALRKRLFVQQALSYPEQEGNLLVFEEELSPDALPQYATLLRERCTGVAGVFAPDGKGALRYVLASRTQDVRLFAKKMNAALSGRGGGSAELAQGTAACSRKDVKRFWSELEEIK